MSEETVVTDKQLADYSHMWGAAKDNYCLLSTVAGGADLNRCFVIDRKNKTVVLIESRELGIEIRQRMLSAGVEILSELPAE
jgi:hypothetical protein